MTLAEDRTEQYIRLHLSHFFRIDVLEILSHLPCLTAADQDKLRAYIERYGNRDSVWKLFDHLRKRTGWVICLITALRECEHSELAEQIENVYTSNLNRFPNHPRGSAASAPAGQAARNQPMSLNTPPRSSGVPGALLPASGSPATKAASSLPDTAYNGYPEELESGEAGAGYTAPIQDTQPPEFKAEVSGAALNPGHSGDTSRSPQSSSGRSSPFSAPAPTVTKKHRKASGGSGDSPPGSVSLPASRGPLSPSVSFVPHSTKKAGPASGLQPPPSPREASSPTSSWGNENRLRAASPIQAAELPEGTVPATRIPRPPKVPPLAPKFPSSPHPAQTPQASPGPAASRQAPPPHAEEVEMSKPGVLQSCDDQPYSGGSERLLISGSSGSVGSLHKSSTPGNLPEENDYFSVTSGPSPGKPEASGPPKQLESSKSPFQETLKLHVDERPSESPLGSGSGLGQTPDTAAQPGECPSGDSSWGVWVGSAVAVLLVSVAVAIFYKRIPK
ncbi:mitochondrial antiviral-signaling protein [Sarcophilus harrisii]|uniref:Mitochondrial antiviral-signaling protein n=1 Tax=Sarcophilus harrisii TaxID=9305 RepID=G3WKW0_SARHA|nr:mitochondrial antiviral-signaling protein [Sarcophilus harrisii]